jgi:lipoyl(octanoyl) transferase
MRVWRYVDTGVGAAACNMAVDEALIRSVGAGESAPVLRLYGWDPPAVSLGYAQDPARELDAELCRALGVQIVRRPTGGRAVLHWDELTYSVVCGADDPQLGGAIEETNRRIGECLEDGLRQLGVPVALQRSGGAGSRPRGRTLAAPCFASAARWEITCGGRKLAGSAQRRVDGVILQHGSLLTGPAHRRICELVVGLSSSERRRWLTALECSSTDLQQCMPQVPAREELSAAMVQGFARRLPAQMLPGELTESEQTLARQLATEKYAHPDWRRVPPPAEAEAVLPNVPAAAAAQP